MGSFCLKKDGISVKVTLTAGELSISSTQDTEVTIQIDDVICTVYNDRSLLNHNSDISTSPTSCAVHYIEKKDNPLWTLQKIVLTDAGEDSLHYLLSKLNPLIQKCIGQRPKKLLFLLNPIGGTRQAQNHFDTIITPVLLLAGVSWELIVSQRSKHFIEVTRDYSFKNVDGVVVLGGDGTFCEVVDVMIRREQEEAGIGYSSPTAKLKPLSTPVGVIPSGSGNLKAAGLYGCLDILTAILHIIKGNTELVPMIAAHSGDELIGFGGIELGISMMADFFYFVDRHLRFLRSFRYLIFPVWYLFQRKALYPYEVTALSRETICDNHGNKTESINRQEKLHLNFMTSVCTLEKWRGPGLCLTVFDVLSLASVIRRIMNIIKKVQENIPGITQYRADDAFRIQMKKSPPERQDKESKRFKVFMDGEIRYTKQEDYYVRSMNDVVSMYTSRKE